MKKNNWFYVLYQTFNSDLLFWIVIDNLFLSTVKGFDAFNIVLISMLGIFFSLLLYPFNNYLIKKISNRTSIIIGSLCYIFSILIFGLSSNIIAFIIGQTIYNSSAPFRAIANVMLKNNLEEANKEDEYIKWQSYGKLGYAIITLLLSLFSGVLFNINPYLPIFLSLVGTLFALLFAILFNDSNSKQVQVESNYDLKPILKNKTMILIALMNILAVGTYTFLQTKSTLLIQYTLEEASLDIAKISIIISVIVFGSRLCRVISDLLFSKLYNKVIDKPKILVGISIFILVANLSFALGGNLNIGYILKIILITIGFYIILYIRDMYSVMETKIIPLTIEKNLQKEAFILTGIYEKLGRLITHIYALVALWYLPLNILYAVMLIFSVSQIFVSIKLSKILKKSFIYELL